MKDKFKGIITAITTPFKKNLTIDYSAFLKHLDFLYDNGINKILLCGTTGEFFSLTKEERLELLKHARKKFPGTIFFHAGADNLFDTINLAKLACDLGADAIFSLPPYYFSNLSEDGIKEYLSKIIENVSVPFLIYNFTRHTQNPITCKIISQLDVFGIKDSDRNFKLISCTKHYYVGGDTIALEASQKGAYGSVSVQGNYVPKLIFKLEKELFTNSSSLKSIKILQDAIIRNSSVIKGINQIGMIKYFLSKKIDYPVYVRPPLLITTQDKIAVDRLFLE